MTKIFDETQWMRRGKQKRLVIQAFSRPRSPSEVLAAVKRRNASITFGDVSNIIAELERRGHLVLLGSGRLTGRVYSLTGTGAKLAGQAFGTDFGQPLTQIDWRKYAVVMAGKTRRAALLAMKTLEGRFENGVTLSQVRRKANGFHPMTLNQATRAMRALLEAGVVWTPGRSKKRNSKLYTLTLDGENISEYLRQVSQQVNDNSF